METILKTKLHIPTLRAAFVSRARLIERLNNGLKSRLTLISAPARFGKSTLVSEWAQNLGDVYQVAWLSLGENDNALERFLFYFVASLQKNIEQIGDEMLEMLQSPQQIDLEICLTSLINDLVDYPGHILFVLDDYHLIGDLQIHQAMSFLVENAPRQFHLVVATREDPPLHLIRLRARNQLTELRAGDLRFTNAEAAEFLNRVMDLNLSVAQIAALETRTEGWIAGLQLAAISMQGLGDTAVFIKTFTGTHRHILDYLLEEVLAGQTEAVRAFLRQTSILEQLTPALCQAVTGQKNSADLLRHLENANLFLLPLDENHAWYRYHALFGDLLQNQLKQIEPERLDDLHQRAADWYRHNGYIQQAVEHAFQISDSGTVLKLIEAHAIPMLYQGEVTAVVNWFDRLPEDFLKEYPMMWISKAWSLALMQRQPRADEVMNALQAAEDALDHINADETLRNLIAGHAASIQAMLMQTQYLTNQIKAEQLILTAQKALTLLPEDEKAIRSVNSLNMGYGYMALADLPAAKAAFTQTFEDGLAGGNLYAGIYGPINLILIAIVQGDLETALALCESNINYFHNLIGDQRFASMGALYIFKGSLLREQNRLDAARQPLTHGLNLVRWTGEYEAHREGLTALARLYATQKNWDEMTATVQTLKETWPEGAIYAHALQHYLSLRYLPANEKTYTDAHAWLEQSNVDFATLPDIQSADPINDVYLQAYLLIAKIMAHLAQHKTYPLNDALNYWQRQQKLAEKRELFGRLVAIHITLALLYQAAGQTEATHKMIRAAVESAVSRGYLRAFVDEGPPMLTLLTGVKPCLDDEAVIHYVDRLLAALADEVPARETTPAPESILSERELEVLHLLAEGLTYNDIAERLIVSVNTVRYHIKGLYGKIGATSRSEALTCAREMNLIQ